MFGFLLVSSLLHATMGAFIESYPRTNSSADIRSLCRSMPDMFGCDIYSACSLIPSNKGYCEPFSILGDICTTDMGQMPGCAEYNDRCDNDLPAQQCKSQPPLPTIPKTADIKKAVDDMCGAMPMSSCGSESRPFMKLANVCNEMDMGECSFVRNFCSQVKARDASLNKALLHEFHCDAGDADRKSPTMIMYFHTGIHEYIWFKSLVPQNDWQYALAIVVVMSCGVVVTLLRNYKLACEIYWRENPIVVGRSMNENTPFDQGPLSENLLEESDTSVSILSKHDTIMTRNFKRALFFGGIVGLDYMLMIISMSYNVGLFVAVVAGFMLGQLFFGHYGHRNVIRASENKEKRWRTAAIRINGMTCDSCVSTVQRALLALPVTRVQVNRAESWGMVSYDLNDVSVQELLHAVNVVGFDATLIAETADPMDPVYRASIENLESSCCTE